MNTEDMTTDALIQAYKTSKIEELEECHPHLRGLKHTFFVMTYDDGQSGCFTTRVISTPQDWTDAQIDQEALRSGTEEPPMMAFGRPLTSVERGTSYDKALKIQGDQ